MSRAASILLTATLGGVLAGGAPARAEAPFEAPWGSQPPEVRASQGVVVVAALGRPDARVGRFSAAKRTARAEGEDRARERLHRWADDALARRRVPAWYARRVHAAVEKGARVRSVRALVDGSAVVVLELPLEQLRSAWGGEGLPWSG